YAELSGDIHPVTTDYRAEWVDRGITPDDDVPGVLARALEARRRSELDRGTTLVGPHRDEWRLAVRGLDARTHGSQGEQRALALALRLGGHRLCADVIGQTPVLLLDDVFSELDEYRSGALVDRLAAPDATESVQTLITTAGALPAGVRADALLQVDDG